MNATRWTPCISLPVLLLLVAQSGFASLTDYRKVVGSDACGDCHVDETEAMKQTLHFRQQSELMGRPAAFEIAHRLGMGDPLEQGLCQGCHLTTALVDGKREILGGVGCESCHGGGRDFLQDHPRDKENAIEEWARIESMGMITPARLYELATRCYGCHLVTSQNLVDRGGHSVGSAFELLSWSQGEVRHNTWYNGGGTNLARGDSGRRLLYLLGTTIENESVMRAISEIQGAGRYQDVLARRLHSAIGQAGALVEACPNLELATVLGDLHELEIGKTSQQTFTELADRLRSMGLKLLERYDGSELECMDDLLPRPDHYRGSPYTPGR